MEKFTVRCNVTATAGCIMLVSVFFFGNPDRGDDAAGHILQQWAEQNLTRTAEQNAELSFRFIYDFQLEPEHIFDLDGCDMAIFVDCVLNQESPTSWSRLQTGSQLMFTSHSVTPESLLFLFETTLKKNAPPCYLLGITCNQFQLGAALSDQTRNAIEEAKNLLHSKLSSEQPH